MESLISKIHSFALFGLDQNNLTAIILALIGGGGIAGLRQAKNKKNEKLEHPDNYQVLFDQGNELREQQKADMAALREEFDALKEELLELRKDNEAKERKINSLTKELATERKRGRELQEQIDTLRNNAEVVAETKVKEDKANELRQSH